MLRNRDDFELITTLEGYRGWERLKRHLIEELEATRIALEECGISDARSNHLRGEICILKKMIGAVGECRKALERMNQDKQTPVEPQAHRKHAAPGS